MARHTFFCVDAHTCGNPVRVVAGGAPLLPNVPMIEKREIFIREHDWVRRALMFEPRGHDVMSGSILYPSAREDCEVGVLYIEVTGCLPMCGHGTIGTVTVAIEEGLVVAARAGAACDRRAGRPRRQSNTCRTAASSIRCGCSTSRAICTPPMSSSTCPGLGALKIDVAYGGNYYAIIEPQKNWSGLDNMPVSEIQRLSLDRARPGRRKIRARASGGCPHPRHPSRHVVRQAAQSARACAQRRVLRRQGDRPLALRHRIVGARARNSPPRASSRSATISCMKASSAPCSTAASRREANVGNYRAIRPSVAGWAQVTGHNTIFVDDRDPLAHGFQVV